MRLRFVITVLCLALGGLIPAARAYEVHIIGDRISLSADHAPLRDILLEFARVGVNVQLDPSLDFTVTGSLENEDMEVALNQLLQSCTFVLFWKVVPGPVGPIPRLSEMQVYQPGHPEAAEPLQTPNANLVVTSGPIVGGPRFVADEILLGVKPGTRLEEFKEFLAQIGGAIVDSIPELGIYQIRLPKGTNIQALVDQLKNNPLVAAVEPNYVVDVPRTTLLKDAADTEERDSASPPPSTNAAAVAVLDSGLLEGVGLDGFVAGRYDSLQPGRMVTDPAGHGTQMAMIAAGVVEPAGASALSDGVPVLAVRAFDDNGSASFFSLIRAIDYAVSEGARVINLSWGTEVSSDFLSTAIGYAQKNGLLVVAAAGNEPKNVPFYPAAYPGVVAVSAMTEDGTLWSESNYGNFISVAAPGTARFSVGYHGPPGSYAGTSIASAYTAKALALYFTRHPQATRDEAIRALRSSVTDSGAGGRDPYYGYGALDDAAMQKLLK